MTTFLGSILAAVLVSQAQGGMIRGKVVDDVGKPVADAMVVGSAPRSLVGSGNEVEIGTRTDAGGGFELDSSRLKRARLFWLWSCRPRSALAIKLSDPPPFDLVLRPSTPRTVKVEGPDGRPLPGARITPLYLQPAGRSSRGEVPDVLAASLIVTTGPDGRATLDYLGNGDVLITARVTAAPIGTQDLQLVENPRRASQGATITIHVGPTKRLAGRVRNRAGQPIAGQEVEVWSKGGTYLRTDRVKFLDGPLRTAADGSFRTPDNLLVGSSYLVAIRAPGFEPILSKWITIGQQPQLLLPMLLRPLRTIRGRVVDRQGKPLAMVEVFQSGDGPERTATRTSGDGRFVLAGFREGPVFVFARREGFRFFGRLIKPGEEAVPIELIRVGERPAPELHVVPESVPQEERIALARRLIEPCWEAAVAKKDQAAAQTALRYLAVADPLGALQKLEADDATPAETAAIIKLRAAMTLARQDSTRAEKVADSIIDSPVYRSTALWALADALPGEMRDRKVALLVRAADRAKDAGTPAATARVAQSLYKLNSLARFWER
jgi:protocatechuate 3,4-dioxygenase beta subunit